MKKGIKNLAIATMVGVASMGLMTGCQKEEDKPYIQVSGLDTAYIQNEDIDLEGAKILYYSNKNDTTADEIKLTESMIANFDTDTTGEKKMKVLWNNLELEINYSVISMENVVSLYNTAVNNLIIANDVHGDMTVAYDGIIEHIVSNISNNKLYSYAVAKQGDVVVDEAQNWIEQDAEVWYEYYYEEDEGGSKRNINSQIQNGNIKEYCLTNFIGSGEIDLNFALGCEDVDYDINDTKIILTFKSLDEENDITTLTKGIIQDGKFVNFTMQQTNAANEVVLEVNSVISYDLEEVEMVDLPTDVQWKDVE